MSRLNQTQSSSAIGTNLTYALGFVLSLGLTITAFILVSHHVNSHHLFLSDRFMLVSLTLLAVTQLFVQLVFFLHLDRESKPWWNNTALVFAAGVVLILVIGSIWIMANLNYHHGAHNVTHNGHILNSPGQTNQYIIQDEGVRP